MLCNQADGEMISTLLVSSPCSNSLEGASGYTPGLNKQFSNPQSVFPPISMYAKEYYIKGTLERLNHLNGF
jgi:hypothetical protein